jgi:eukaryotic-like serine/threonine-protein kinase
VSRRDPDKAVGDATDMTGSTITAVGSAPQRASLDRDLLKASLKAELFGVVPEPTRVGRYALMKRIAVGGMGEVYAAYDEQLDRKVAIKLVRPDRLGPGGQNHDPTGQRLIREAQTLARLSHPNVVQVYEAGQCGNRVFLAMEFIRGRSLRQWLEQRREIVEPDKWRTILSMFQSAGRGLQAAHAAGLVHRDFKPDNVLVGDDGRVCVADFGLARPVASDAQITQPASLRAVIGTPAEGELIEKLLGEPSPLSSLPNLTQSGTMLGTPAYMSPEQMEGAPSDWRSDQFAFCVALYEALYNGLPFAASDLRSLHARMTSGAATPPPRKSEVPAWVWKVVERGLSVDPAARYASMGELLAALAADPARRRARILGRAFLGGGGIAALLVFLFLVPERRAAVDPCAEAGNGVDGVWNPARAEQIRQSFLATKVPYAAEAAGAVHKHLERYAGELRAERKASCVATHVRHEQTEQLAELQTLCLDRRERHLDALATELGRADDQVVERGTESAASLPRVDRCRDREALTLGVQPPEDAALAARVERVQKQLAAARAQRLSGRRTEALDLIQTLLKTSEQAEYPPLRAELLAELGLLQRDGATSDEGKQGEETLLESVDLAERYRDDELVSALWFDLARLGYLHQQSNLVKANQWARRAMATSWRLNDGGRQRSAALSIRGSLAFSEGKHEQAELLLRDAVKLAETSGENPISLAFRMQSLAGVLDRMNGRAGESKQLYARALQILDTELGVGHPLSAGLLYDYGIALQSAGDLDGSRQMRKRAMAIWKAIHGDKKSLDIGDTQMALGNLEVNVGQLERAAEHARLAREEYREALTDPTSSRHTQLLLLDGLVARRRGDLPAALAAYEEALALARRTAAHNPVRMNNVLCGLGDVLVAMGRHDRALAIFAEAEEAQKKIEGGATPLRVAMLLKGRGLALFGKGNAPGAVALVERALIFMQGQTGYPLDVAEVQWGLAQALRRAGDASPERAEELARQALKTYRELGAGLGKAGSSTTEAIERWLSQSSRPT